MVKEMSIFWQHENYNKDRQMENTAGLWHILKLKMYFFLPLVLLHFIHFVPIKKINVENINKSIIIPIIGIIISTKWNNAFTKSE